MIHPIKSLATICLISLFAFGGNSAVAAGCPDPSAYPFNACDLPNTRPGSFPYFDQAVKVRFRERSGGDFNLTATFDSGSGRSSLLFSDLYSENIGRTTFKLRARVRNGLATGTIRIKGKMPGIGINKKRTLLKANLEGAWDISADNKLIGFDTVNIVCHDNINDLGFCKSDAESIYLALDDPIFTGQRRINTNGIAVTTVPIPAVAWLFGSGIGLLGLVGGGARRKEAA